MNLQDYYDTMRLDAFRHLARGETQLDSQLHTLQDDRRGLTLRAKLPAPIATRVEQMLANFREIEPEQYYYPASDLHLTISSVISCYPGFTLETVEPAVYQQAVRASLQASEPFTVTYTGITASARAVILQGTPADEGLVQLREQVRSFFQQIGLSQSMDERYQLQTAHSTVIRFRSPLRDPARLIEKVAAYQHYLFGSFRVEALELVYNDWYHRAPNTLVLETYPLGSSERR
ncbi:2'-5' RNA ligase family protein [Hymenobacter volaticus]|uniref:Mutarotase n=1 Tax=Hymenobacter volaticus TaxID=2932254 RepID=A0ABY4GG90_9BACT|nr:2'-5' RNA ligase family protein [Hymenobacter volaticus]UOQ69851.1 mutarotase [Hymenobacter volaticus]